MLVLQGRPRAHPECGAEWGQDGAMQHLRQPSAVCWGRFPGEGGRGVYFGCCLEIKVRKNILNKKLKLHLILPSLCHFERYRKR